MVLAVGHRGDPRDAAAVHDQGRGRGRGAAGARPRRPLHRRWCRSRSRTGWTGRSCAWGDPAAPARLRRGILGTVAFAVTALLVLQLAVHPEYAAGLGAPGHGAGLAERLAVGGRLLRGPQPAGGVGPDPPARAGPAHPLARAGAGGLAGRRGRGLDRWLPRHPDRRGARGPARRPRPDPQPGRRPSCRGPASSQRPRAAAAGTRGSPRTAAPPAGSCRWSSSPRRAVAARRRSGPHWPWTAPSAGTGSARRASSRSPASPGGAVGLTTALAVPPTTDAAALVDDDDRRGPALDRARHDDAARRAATAHLPARAAGSTAPQELEDAWGRAAPAAFGSRRRPHLPRPGRGLVADPRRRRRAAAQRRPGHRARRFVGVRRLPRAGHQRAPDLLRQPRLPDPGQRGDRHRPAGRGLRLDRRAGPAAPLASRRGRPELPRGRPAFGVLPGGGRRDRGGAAVHRARAPPRRCWRRGSRWSPRRAR